MEHLSSAPAARVTDGASSSRSHGGSLPGGLARRIARALAVVAAAFAIALPAHAVTLLGPADPSVLPLGTSYSCIPACNPAAPAYGRAGGQTWSYAAVPLAGVTSVWHGPVDGSAVKVSFLSNTFSAPGEVLSYDAASSNAAAGVLVFKGQTQLPPALTPVFTRVTFTFTTSVGAPIALVTSSSIGAPSGIGLIAPVPSAGFKLNFLVEASFTNGAGYQPALDFYDAQTTVGGSAFFDFTAGFYWNDVPPTLVKNTGMTLAQGATKTITTAMLQATDVESPASALTFTIPVSGGGTVHQGTLTKSGNPLIAGSTFTQDDIDTSKIAYQHDNTCTTSDNFQFSVSDPDGGVIPPPPGPPTVFSFPITVTLVNQPPVANSASFSVGLGASHNGNLTASNSDCFTPTYTFSLASGPNKGIVVLNNASTGDFTYTASPGQSGADSFTFNVSDGVVGSVTPGTISITIANQPPVANSQAVATLQGVPVSGTLTATDPDQPPQPLAYSIVSNGTKGTAVISNPATGAFDYTPAAGRMGTDTFTFKANDGSLDSNTATVTVAIRGIVTPGRVVVTAGASSGKNKEVVLVDPTSGDQSVLAAVAGPTSDLRGVAIEATGKILATDAGTASILRFDPADGSSSTLASGLSGFLIGMGLEANGNILVATGPAGAVSRRSPVTGAEINAFSGGLLSVPTSVTAGPNGDIFVTDAGGLFGGTNRVIRIDPASGAQTLLTSGGNLVAPIAVALNATNELYVTDSPQAIGQGAPLSSQVIQVPSAGGAQTVVSSAGSLSGPAGIAVAGNGTLLTANAAGNSIVRVNPVGGAQSTVSSGGELTGAFGLAQYVLSLGSCTYSVSPLDRSNLSSTGGQVTVTVTTPNGCPVAANSYQSWVTVVSVTPLVGSTLVTLQISPNAGGARSTSIQIADRLYFISQLAGP